MSAKEKLSFRKKGHPQNSKQPQEWEQTDVNDTLNVFDNSESRTPTLVRVYESHAQDARYRDLGGVCQTVSATYGTGGNNIPMVDNSAVVRRLTPMECERLQGFPDGYTDIGEWVDSKGKKHKEADSPRYKALGNSIALPFWEWMAGRMCEQLRKDGNEKPTMASLFDGISGFCLVYARNGCKPVWASEVESFCIAVAKKHFGDDDKGERGDYEQYL